MVVIVVAHRLRDLPEQDRQKAISAAVKAGDDLVVHAALGMPGLCTGLNDQLREYVRKEWAVTRHRQEFARLERLERIETDLRRSGGLLQSFNHALYGAALATEGEKAESAKQAALKGIA